MTGCRSRGAVVLLCVSAVGVGGALSVAASTTPHSPAFNVNPSKTTTPPAPTTVVAAAAPTTSVSTGVAPPTSTALPSTVELPGTAVPTSASSGSDPGVPPMDPQLAGRIPQVAGFSTVPGLPEAYLWPFYGIPDGFTVYTAAILGGDGAEIGRLIVA